jgi:hypothetical protein
VFASKEHYRPLVVLNCENAACGRRFRVRNLLLRSKSTQTSPALEFMRALRALPPRVPQMLLAQKPDAMHIAPRPWRIMSDLEDALRNSIRTIKDYPKPGILFRDITTLLGEPRAFSRSVDELVHPYAG